MAGSLPFPDGFATEFCLEISLNFRNEGNEINAGAEFELDGSINAVGSSTKGFDPRASG